MRRALYAQLAGHLEQQGWVIYQVSDTIRTTRSPVIFSTYAVAHNRAHIRITKYSVTTWVMLTWGASPDATDVEYGIPSKHEASLRNALNHFHDSVSHIDECSDVFGQVSRLSS